MRTFYIIYIIFISSLFSLNSAAQPTFTMADIGFQIGDLIQMDSVAYVDMSNMTGPNMIWDLNDITFGNTVVDTELLSIDDVVSPVSFPGANMVRKFTVEGLEFYQYYTQNANDVQFNGFFSEFSGSVISNIFENTQEIYSTPMTYGSTGSDTYNSNLSSLGSTGELTGSSSFEIVGYGTLLLDGETHNDVLLMNLMTNETTVNVFGGMEFESVSTEDAYLFFKAGFHFPLLTFSHLSTDNGIFGSEEDFAGTILLQQTTTGIEERETIEFSIYPNPTYNDEVTIQFAESNATELIISLIDPLGRVHQIEKAYLIGDNNQLQVVLPKNLSSGIYHVVISGDKVNGSEIIVIQ